MTNPYESPQFASEPAMPFAPAGIDREKLRRVARYQQWVLYALLANICVNIAAMAARQSENVLLSLMIVLAALIVVILGMVAIFLLASELYNTVLGVLCALLMIVPCISLITLLIVNSKATGFLQQQGIQVGLMGANPNKI